MIGFGQTNIKIEENANQSYKNSDAELNEVYREILNEYSNDTIFIKALRISQRNWIKFRNSELKMKYPDEFIASISNFLKEYGVLKSIFLQPRMLINFMYLKLRRVLGQIIPNKMKKQLSKNKI